MRLRKGSAGPAPSPIPGGGLLVLLFALLPLFFSGCAQPGPRPSYDRASGDYSTGGEAGQGGGDAWGTGAPEAPGGSAGMGAPGAGGRPPDPSRLREVAESYLGTPYRYAGSTRAGMDCSGFVGAVFAQVYGVTLPRSSREMAAIGSAVDEEDLKPGDLVFFKDFMRVNHAGIFIGEGRFIHASTSKGVEYNRLDFPYYRKRFAGARRLF